MARLMRIAYLTPLPPLQMGTGHYSEELLPHLCQHAQVDVYTDDRLAAAQEVGKAYRLYGYHDFVRAGSYDHVIYQLANSAAHLPIYELFRRHGGVVVLHDLDLSSVIEASRQGQGNGRVQLRPMEPHGSLWPFLRTARDVVLRRPWSLRGWERDGAVVERASGIIVHSRAAYQHLTGRYPHARVRQVPLCIRRPPAIDAAEARRLLDLPAGGFVVVSAGEVPAGARLHVLWQALSRLLERCPESYCLLLSEVSAGSGTEGVPQLLGDRVRAVAAADLATLYRCLAAADVGIDLGVPGDGHLPASLLRMMSLGRPAVVTDCPPYAELPDDCALKVEAGAGEAAQLGATLWALAGYPPLRHWYGQRAARYVQTQHTPATTARHYLEFLERIGTLQAPEALLLGEGGS